MIDKVIIHHGAPTGLYTYRNFFEFMSRLSDTNKARPVSLSNNETSVGLEGAVKCSMGLSPQLAVET